eukprot:TRINITY_DN3871_c0_g8_i1.p1 TRINITY_DN3871_c0_g8~~TRINITY_DN3871_c0_g8_i1.p1  ORF type:complete len:166 (-),score=3.43 TRINITY_DN3871_c0_g8_i1:97-594(-)
MGIIARTCLFVLTLLLVIATIVITRRDSTAVKCVKGKETSKVQRMLCQHQKGLHLKPQTFDLSEKQNRIRRRDRYPREEIGDKIDDIAAAKIFDQELNSRGTSDGERRRDRGCGKYWVCSPSLVCKEDPDDERCLHNTICREETVCDGDRRDRHKVYILLRPFDS